MQRAFLLAEQAVRGCLTRLSVHYRVIFILHRQVGTAGTNRCRCVQLARANKAKLARERRVQKTARANRPCELQAWAVVRAGCARLSPRNNGSCGAVRQRRAMARSWFAATAVVARLHGRTTQGHPQPVRGACSALQACCFATSTPKPQPHTHRRANEVACHRRQARGAGELQGEEERFWTHGCSLLFDFFTKVKNAPGPPRPRRRRLPPLR